MELLVQRKLPPLGFAKPRFAAFDRYLADDRAIDRGVGRLASRRFPEVFGKRRFDDFLGVHRLSGFCKHHCSGVQAADPFGFVGLFLFRPGLFLGLPGIRRLLGDIRLVALFAIALIIHLRAAAVRANGCGGLRLGLGFDGLRCVGFVFDLGLLGLGGRRVAADGLAQFGRRLDANLLVGHQVGAVLATIAAFGVDPHLDEPVGHLGGVNAADLHFVLFMTFLLC